MDKHPTRRSALTSLAKGTAALAATGGIASTYSDSKMDTPLKGNIHHSVCRWCFKNNSLEELCEASAKIGIESIDLVGVEDLPTINKYGLTSALTWGVPGGITNGLNRLENHYAIVEFFEDNLPKVAAAGVPNSICFSGNRDGMDDEQGLENCAIGLKRLMPIAEKAGVTIVMELLNSKRNHADYMCDYTSWGVELCKRVGSERFKLLYDIYHMQIMEGDVIATIQEFSDYFAHYHTAGVPGRHEIDDTQELFYPAIMKAIVATGFTGYVAQEFLPERDPFKSLAEAVRICDV